MYFKLFLLILLLSFFPLKSYAERSTLFSANTGSFLFHLVPFDTHSNQYLNNEYFSIEKKLSEDSEYSLFAGTFLNSQANRCLLLGLRKDWYRVNDRLMIKGIYSYAGEFFFDAFENCGDGGFYKTSAKITGLAFAPYIYHAAQYNFNDNVAIEAGFILPILLVISIQWSF